MTDAPIPIHNEASLAQALNRMRQIEEKNLISRMKGPDNGGEPPGGDMLEARVLRLEDDVKEIRTDMKDVRDRLSRIEGKIGMLPGWGGLLAVAGFIVTAVGLMIRFMPPAG
ncbi:hypothetical protein [Celeribacter naphthalenivorans]|uniref:hypothetical protein n=1 Tax=Celeribacter naphthalenivorans TaxID=1614694 RepID=UPI001CF94EF3|nr:hypothetical protein [Celeribacter naphthalenivorans]